MNADRTNSTTKFFFSDFKGIISLFRGYWAKLTIAVIFAVLSTAFAVFAPKILGEATNQLLSHDGTSFNDFLKLLLNAGVLFVLSCICQCIQSIISTNVSKRISFNLRNQIVKKMNSSKCAYMESDSKGDLIFRAINDVDILTLNLADVFLNTIKALVLIIFSFVMIMTINTVIALVVLVVLLVGIIILLFTITISQLRCYEQRNIDGNINGFVEDLVSDLFLASFYNKKGNIFHAFKNQNNELCSKKIKAGVLSLSSVPLLRLSSNLSYVFIVIYGVYCCIAGSMSIGSIQACLQYVNSFKNPLENLMQLLNSVQYMASANNRINSFLSEKPFTDHIVLSNNSFTDKKIEEEPKNRTIRRDCVNQENPITIQIKNLNFGYERKKNILKNINLEILPKEKIAIVGKTGCGKSTLIKLLLKLYKANDNSIYLNEKDINDLDDDCARSVFSVVMQENWLRNDTVCNNIRYCDIEDESEIIPEESINKVNKIVSVLGIDTFNENKDSVNDFVLSSAEAICGYSQKQMISIARALYSNSPIVIFDEPTNGLDGEYKEKFQNIFDVLLRDKTVLMITHDLDHIKAADKIVFMDDGSIVEVGTHDYLLQSCAEYKKMIDLGIQ